VGGVGFLKKYVVPFMAIIFVTILLGIFVYKNSMQKDMSLGLTLNVENVSSNGLTLNLKTEKPSLAFAVGNGYQLQKFTIVGWKSISLSQRIAEVIESKNSDVNEYTKKWNVKWVYRRNQHELEELKPGIYRISKKIMIKDEQGVENQRILYAPFLIFEWWNILGIILLVLIVFATALFIKFRWHSVRRKKRFWVTSLLVLSLFLLTCKAVDHMFWFMYYYEVPYVVDVYYSAGISEMARMELYDKKGMGFRNFQVSTAFAENKPIELSEESMLVIQDIFDDKALDAYTRLWFQYDVVIVVEKNEYKNEKYMVNLKDKEVYVEHEGIDGVEKYFELTKEENDKLKELLGKD